MGLNATLMTAGRSLELFTAGIQVAGQNVANANTPGYVREELGLGTNTPYEAGGLILGTGARDNGIRQQLDYHLEQQLHAANTDAGSADIRSEVYGRLELILGELGSGDLSSQLNAFSASINEVVNQPELISNRQIVLQEGAQLATSIQDIRANVDRTRTALTSDIKGFVDEVNGLVDSIAKLNTQIVRLESAGLNGSQAGGLRSERLTALNRLSELVPIRTNEHSTGSIDVHSGSDFLVLNGNSQHLETTTKSDRGVITSEVNFAKSKSPLTSTSGELGGAIDARDNILGGFADDLDKYAQAVIQEVNLIHASGEGLKGYESVTATNTIDDTSASLNTAGLGLTPKHGSFEIKIYDRATEATVTTRINIDLDGLNGNDTSLDDLQAALDAVGNLSASIDNVGRLTLEADAGFEVKFSNDSSGTLAALGINTFFQGKDSNDIAVNETLKNNPHLFAAGLGNGPGDNLNAQSLATFFTNPSSRLGNVSLDDFYSSLTSQIASSSAAESALAEGFNSYHNSLGGLRLQNSGVSLDEEAINIMELQQSYAAAARIISTVDELFNVLLSI